MKDLLIPLFFMFLLVDRGIGLIISEKRDGGLIKGIDSDNGISEFMKRRKSVRSLFRVGRHGAEAISFRNSINLGKYGKVQLTDLEYDNTPFQHETDPNSPQPRKLLTTDGFGSDKPTERKLMAIDDISQRLIEAAAKSDFIIKPADDGDPASYFINDMTGDEFIVERGGDAVFAVTLDEPDLGSKNKKVIISNRPVGEDFEDFEHNHFEFKIGIDASQEGKPEFEASIDQFLDTATKTIAEKLRHLNYVNMAGEAVTNALNANVAGVDFEFADLKETENLELKRIATKITARVQSTKAEFFFILSPTYERMYNFKLLNSRVHFEFDFDIFMTDDVFAHASKTIHDILTIDLKAAHNILFYAEKIGKGFQSKKCQVPALEPNPYNIFEFAFAPDDKKNKNCELPDYKVTLTGFNVAYLNSIHLRAESELLVQEFVIALNRDFDHVLDSIIADLVLEENETKVALKKNKKNEIIEETLDGIYKIINGLKKGKIVCDAPKQGKFICHYKIGARDHTVLIASEMDDEEEFFRISLIDPPHDGDSKSEGYSHPEIYLNKFNGYDQKLRLKKHIQPFFAKVSNIK